MSQVHWSDSERVLPWPCSPWLLCSFMLIMGKQLVLLGIVVCCHSGWDYGHWCDQTKPGYPPPSPPPPPLGAALRVQHGAAAHLRPSTCPPPHTHTWAPASCLDLLNNIAFWNIVCSALLLALHSGTMRISLGHQTGGLNSFTNPTHIWQVILVFGSGFTMKMYTTSFWLVWDKN